MPGPYLAEYIATKHYMHSFTEVQLQLLSNNSKPVSNESNSKSSKFLSAVPGTWGRRHRGDDTGDEPRGGEHWDD